MKKRVLGVILIVLICIFGLVACKKNVGTPEDNPVSEEEEEEEENTPKYTFGYSGITMSNPYFIALEKAIRNEVEAEGNLLIEKNPEMNVETQIAQINEMIEEGIDVLFLSPVDGKAIEPALVALKEAEVVIINIDTEVQNLDAIDAYVGTDNKKAGYICGENLIKKQPKGGRVAILEVPGSRAIAERILGFEEAIKDKGFEVVTRQEVEGDIESAMTTVAAILEKEKDIDAIMCGNDPTALGALVAVQAADVKDIQIYGVDGSPDIKKELSRSGVQIAGTAAQSPINIGKVAVETSIAILENGNFEKMNYEGTFFIDQENISLYGIDGWQ